MAPSSSCHDIEVKHEVFVSFRGTDVRKGLLSHLKKALRSRHIDTYEDEKLERGDEISPSLLTAIEESQILLVIFSKDYASSKWCLDELAKMIECMEKYKRVLLPVFFNVDPSHVRNQLDEYGNALAKHEETLRENLLKVQSWRSALNKAGHLSGFHYPKNYKDESDLVHKIVEDILEKLSRFGPSESNGLVGIDQNIAQIQSLLLMESSEVRFVGIWGMGGIGKTTIARDIYDKYFLQYDGCCILNVREELEKQELRPLREKLISLLDGEGLPTSGRSKASYISAGVSRLKLKKVLIVLDDVNTSQQLKKLVREGISFGPGSRVIITSRDRHVLTSGGVIHIHEVKKLDPQDSLKLFCLNAFNECHPKMGYEKLSEEVVKIAHGNPLALEVLGSDFHSRSSIETWTCALNKIKMYPHQEIQRVLRFSYDELPDDIYRNAFLEIAFFFIEDDKDYVIKQLDDGDFHGASGIEVLQQKALVTISNDNRIQMHDLIREMGFEIVRQESPNYPGIRSRLKGEDVYHVLRNKLGTDKVEAMQIDVTSQFTDLLPLNVDTFKKMPRLRFLKFNFPLHAEISLPQSHVEALLQNIVDSRRDHNRLANMLVELPQFSMGTNLECANLRSCHSEHDLVNSSSIQGRRSKQLMELPDMSEGSNLDKELHLESESVRHAHEPIFSMQKQVASLLSGCEELISVASEVHIKCLYYLVIEGCPGLKEFSVTSKETRELNITQPGMEILNSSIGCLSNLEGTEVDDLPFKNLNKDPLFLISTYYLKLSKSKGQDTGKPKLHILFDGLRFSQRVSLDELHYSVAVPQNIGVFSWCRELIVEETCLEMLKVALPPGTKVRAGTFPDSNSMRRWFRFVCNQIGYDYVYATRCTRSHPEEWMMRVLEGIVSLSFQRYTIYLGLSKWNIQWWIHKLILGPAWDGWKGSERRGK